MNIKELFGDRRFNRKLWSLMFPSTMQNLMLALVAAADAVMLGRLNQNSMAAVSLATQIQFIQNMLLWTVASGVSILGAQYWGKGDLRVMEKIFASSIRKSVVVSLVFFVGCFWYPHLLMKLFASDPVLIDIGAEYLRAASWSYLIAGTSQCYLSVMRVSDHVSRSAWISSGAVVMNIVFNAIFIFGLCGVPAMGAKGAAYATVVARVIELLWCIYSTLDKSYVKLRLSKLLSFDKLLEKDFWHYSLPVLGSSLLWGIGFTSYTAIMGHMGSDAAAANAVAAVARDLMCCLCNGLAIGCGILIGNELGAGRLELGKKYGERSMLFSVAIGLLSMAVILLSIPVVSKMVLLNEQAHKYMVGMFLILSVYMIGRCICTVVLNGVFYAGGDAKFDLHSLIVCMWGIALPCAFLGAFYFHFPVLVIYACTCLDEVGKVPWVIIHYKRYKWVRNITRD
ncbi:MAG: MATE family efflux transporter [Lentisphaeria bacterium]|nr:MATE family efflux transporter [Lentisphaeria bacterium]